MKHLSLLAAFALFCQAQAADQPVIPGEHKKQSCAIAEQTFDLFLPKAYADKPEKKFPVVYLSSPNKNPGFHQLQAWAEKNEVVLITINESQNGEWGPIFTAQDAVWEGTSYLRLHPNLRFAIGFSGAGLAGLELAKRKDQQFAGVLLHSHSGVDTNGDVPEVPKHLAFAFISGEKDQTHPSKWTRYSSRILEKSHYVQAHFVPDMGHEWRDGALQEQCLSNLLQYAWLTHPALTAAERQTHLVAFGKRLETLAGKSPPQERLALTDPLFTCSQLRQEPIWQQGVDVWCAAEAEVLSAAGTGLAAFKLAMDPKTAARLKLAKSAQEAVATAVKPILGNPELRAEIAAYHLYAVQANQERKDRVNSSWNAADCKKAYEQLAASQPGTWAAELANAAALRLSN